MENLFGELEYLSGQMGAWTVWTVTGKKGFDRHIEDLKAINNKSRELISYIKNNKTGDGIGLLRETVSLLSAIEEKSYYASDLLQSQKKRGNDNWGTINGICDCYKEDFRQLAEKISVIKHELSAQFVIPSHKKQEQAKQSPQFDRKQERTLQICKMKTENPGLTCESIGKELGLSASTVCRNPGWKEAIAINTGTPRPGLRTKQEDGTSDVDGID